MGDPTPRSPRPNNFYGILGIPRTASLSDIGKAYKSLVMRWHPDKNASNKEEAEAKFKEINEAYTVLRSKKRGENNEPMTPGKSFHRQSVDFDSFFSNQPSFSQKNFSNQPSFSQRNFSNPPSFSRSTSRRSTTPTPSPRPLSRNSSRRSTTPTPADFYASLSRSTSGVTTPKSPTTPTAFQATPKTPTTTTEFQQPFLSKVTSRRNSTPIIFSQSTARRKPQPIEKKLECTLEELCHGCVKKIKITRDAISDNGMIIQEEEILKIKVKPGWKKGTKITFEGKGDERPGTLPADIIFSIDEKRHPLFKREGDDLEIGVEIPLVKALTGCTITVPLLGGDKMTLSFDDIIYPGYEKAIRGQGMPISREQGRRGDLRLKFLVMFPTELSEEQISDVLSILNECS